jgi:hypothetical protein
MPQKAGLFYAKDSPLFAREKPYMILTGFDGESGATNIEWESKVSETLDDIRGREEDFTLDGQGFSFVSHQTSFLAWDDRRAVEEAYLPEVERLIRDNVDGVDEVQIFDWRVGCASARFRSVDGDGS